MYNTRVALTSSKDYEILTLKVSGIIQLLILTRHLYLSGVWLDVGLRTNTKKTRVFLKIGVCANIVYSRYVLP